MMAKLFLCVSLLVAGVSTVAVATTEKTNDLYTKVVLSDNNIKLICVMNKKLTWGTGVYTVINGTGGSSIAVIENDSNCKR